jgi:hypothetical protein
LKEFRAIGDSDKKNKVKYVADRVVMVKVQESE